MNTIVSIIICLLFLLLFVGLPINRKNPLKRKSRKIKRRNLRS